MMDDMLEERLGGGRSTTGIVRIGETLRRPLGPWTPPIHAFLRHLHASGFAAAPEVFGLDDQGREILSYIPGETWGDHIDPDEPKTELVTVRPWPEATRSESPLAEIGRLYSICTAPRGASGRRRRSGGSTSCRCTRAKSCAMATPGHGTSSIARAYPLR